jgi:phosphoenolpyruvate carboxykinase (GTP)
MPAKGDLDVASLDMPQADMDELMRVDNAAFKAEFQDLDEYMAQFGARVPERMTRQVAAYKQRLG